ncbi:unnamed protein product [Blepharisma stoltei]|uniref:Uncharacterized protein n=1 Tax=Blepharisma stoltei TaxID=1481888 RepID=A0AAU9K354_9CILI|nr:unnamed protein product [Blepharisma stoltei]
MIDVQLEDPISPPHSPINPPHNIPSLFSTPDFPKVSLSSNPGHHRSFSRESALIKETIDQLCRDNKILLQKICDLEKSKDTLEIDHQKEISQIEKNSKAKIESLEALLKEKEAQSEEYYKQMKIYEKETIKLRDEMSMLKDQTLNLSSKKFNKVQMYDNKMKKQFENLIKITDENAEIQSGIEAELLTLDHDESLMRSTLIYEDTPNISAIQEEGIIQSLGQTCSDTALMPISLNIGTRRNINNTRASVSTFGSIQDDIDIYSLILPGNTIQQDELSLIKRLRKKEDEIVQHKDFIRQLKSSLEAILAEHSKSKKENEINKQEIKELREKLGLTIPRVLQ